MTDNQLWGYRRSDGRWGIRNHVAVISAMDNSNPTVRRVTSTVLGTRGVCTVFGRGLLGEDAALHMKTMIRMSTNPNIYGAVVISLEQKSADELAEAIAQTGRPVEAYAIEEKGGSNKCAELAVSRAIQFSVDAGRMRREQMPWSELIMGVECGGSDGSSGIVSNPVTGLVADKVIDRGGTVIMSETMEILGGEHLLAERAVDKTVAKKLIDAVNYCVTYSAELGIDAMGANPAPDNILGGLSTIEEKALGAIKKGGSRPLVEVVSLGQRPSRKGFVVMDAPCPAVENLTALAAGGAQVIIFSTGKGNVSGHPIVPVIKVSGNPYTVESLGDNIDVDVSDVITRSMSLEKAAEILDTSLIEVCYGKPTKADLLGEHEVAISRIARCL